MGEATRNEFLGRAYFHRAYRYMNLCFQFGDVPFVSKIIESPKQDYKSTKREAIIKRMVQDMEFAVQNVPDQKDMTYIGMINKGACRQLLIKCYLANGEFQKAKEQADILIEQSGYSLMQDEFGTFSNPNPKTWNITNNVIWDLHQGGNKAIAANKEAILVLPNRYGSDSGIRTRTMRNLVPRWNADEIKTPDNVRAVDNFALNNPDYKDNLDFNRTFGRGQAVVRPTYFAENSLWYVNGVNDEGDLRHSHTVGNWVRMEDLNTIVRILNTTEKTFVIVGLTRTVSFKCSAPTQSVAGSIGLIIRFGPNLPKMKHLLPINTMVVVMRIFIATDLRKLICSVPKPNIIWEMLLPQMTLMLCGNVLSVNSFILRLI